MSSVHYQLMLQVSKTQSTAVAQAVAASVRKAVESAVGAQVTDTFNPVFTDFDSEGYVAFGNTLPANPVPTPTGFGGAIDALKAGKKVARVGWNGQGVWLKLVESGDYTLGPSLLGDTEISGQGRWIGIKAVGGIFAPWLASQTDMLAEDWMVVTDTPTPVSEPASQPGA